MQSISVVLPNYNGKQLLSKNLPSLFDALDAAECDYEVIVVDDGSSDDSTIFLTEHYPQIRLIVNEVNRGFSATCNRGISCAGKQLVCVSNTDVTFTRDYFIQSAKYFSDDNVFAVKGVIANYRDNTEQLINEEHTSKLYYKRGFLRFDQRVEPVHELSNRINGQFVLLGCCFIAERKKLLELGGYNEIFSPYYWEDSDLPLRAMRKGYRLVYAPECRVYHQVSSTIATTQSHLKRRLVSIRNKIMFTWFHLEQGYRASHYFWLLLSIASRWLILDWKFYTSLVMATYRYHSFPKHQPLEQTP